MEELRETELNDDELMGEEMTISRAITNITNFLRFLQLLCENHNIHLQKSLQSQTNVNGYVKMRPVDLTE